MSQYLCITARFLNTMFHGRGAGGEPEWPPSPLRVFQALTAAAAQRFRSEAEFAAASTALQWIEQQPPPLIISSNGRPGQVYRLYCPDNIGDRVAASWKRGGEASVADSRTEKDVRPTHLDHEEVHFIWPIPISSAVGTDCLCQISRSITHLGWGIDQVVGNSQVLSAEDLARLQGTRWMPGFGLCSQELRAPRPGTLQALLARHARSLRRIDRDDRGQEFFNPVPALTTFDVIKYRQHNTAPPTPWAIFQLQGDESRRPFRYPQEKLIHIAGMVRHLAIEVLRRSPPSGVDDGWLETFVAGHAPPGANLLPRFSYIPLPSIGHQHADQRIRRVMIAAPAGCESWLDHLTNLISGAALRPTPETQMPYPPTVVHVRGDSVARCYTGSSKVWHSVTPVILPGHNDKSPAKTRKLIAKALLQSGISQPCEFEFSPYSRFPKSLTAHKYNRNGEPTGYVWPDHLLRLSAVHLKLEFETDYTGPLLIGAGRHMGLGLFAPESR